MLQAKDKRVSEEDTARTFSIKTTADIKTEGVQSTGEASVRNLALVEVKPLWQGETHGDSVGSGSNVSQLQLRECDGVLSRSSGLAAGKQAESGVEVALCRARRSRFSNLACVNTRRLGTDRVWTSSWTRSNATMRHFAAPCGLPLGVRVLWQAASSERRRHICSHFAYDTVSSPVHVMMPSHWGECSVMK